MVVIVVLAVLLFFSHDFVLTVPFIISTVFVAVNAIVTVVAICYCYFCSIYCRSFYCYCRFIALTFALTLISFLINNHITTIQCHQKKIELTNWKIFAQIIYCEGILITITQTSRIKSLRFLNQIRFNNGL